MHRALYVFFFLMIRQPPRSTQSRSSAASDVYKRQGLYQGHSIPKESAWTPPAGLYIFYNVDDNISIQISYGSVFLTAVPPGTGGMFLTDGSILRLYNSYENASKTVYYRKLL